jgi:hypothetical protein
MVRKLRQISWWRALTKRLVNVRTARQPRDPNDMGDMGTAFGLDACLQADAEFRAFQASRQATADAVERNTQRAADATDRLNGRSVI